MRHAGYPILGSIDILYVENYDPEDPSSVADGESFPEALLENGDFQQDLREELIEVASEMEDLNVEVFCPMSEADRVFGSTADATAFFQTFITELESQYTGQLMWIGFAVEESVTAGTAGIIFWEGASGEIQFDEFANIGDYITGLFN